MLYRMLGLALLAVLVFALAPSQVCAKAWYDPGNAEINQSSKVTQYSFPQVRSELTAREAPRDPTPEEAAAMRRNSPISLGQTEAMAPSSPGFNVYNTYMDDQYRPPAGRMIDFRENADIHFVYSQASGPASFSGFGYNVYDPVLGDWPRGAGVGCRVQPTDQNGQWVMMDVDPRGFVVMGGEDDAGGSMENHFYWQNTRQSCFFGGGSIIPSSQYNDGQFLNPSVSHLSHPKIEIQEWGPDTVMHVLAGESDADWASFPDFNWGTTSYYRRVGVGGAGSWQGPIVIDTNAWGFTGSMSASRTSPKVAVSYTKYHELAFVHDQVFDCEVYIRVSDSVGLNWGPPTNITTYSRVEPSNAAWLETSTLYDSDGYLHVIWNATATVENVYDDPIYFWGDFSASIFHWTDRVAGPKAGGTIVKVHDANWGIDYNTQVCGFGSPGTMYVGFFSLSECNGRLYTFFSQYLDAYGNWDYGPEIDDCASGGFSDRLYAANGEVAMTVSSSLDGILWDAARNLTDTYTPDCDSAGFGGVCMNDTRVTASRYGMDVSAYDTSGVPVELTWPGSELVDPTPEGEPAYSGNHFIHAMYLEDHFPGPGWRNVEQYGRLTSNALRWMRVACVDPIQAPQISASRVRFGYPDYIPHGQTDTNTITVTNDGNVTLTVDSIITEEDAGGPTGWLGVSKAGPFTVDAGVNNTNTFDLYLNQGPVVNSPGTIVALNGEVRIYSDAANVDPLGIAIEDFLVVDTVIGFTFDTIATAVVPRGAEPGEYVSLVVTNTGEMGFNGNSNQGGLNLDYVGGEFDCNNDAAVYLYSGGPMLIRADVDGVDTTFVASQGMFQNVFSTDRAFKAIPEGEQPTSLSTAEYDGFFTGTAVNQDSSIAMERTYYAPLTGGDSTDFIIIQTRYFSNDAEAHSPLIIGETIDWDIPGGIGSAAINVSGLLASRGVVYQQGVDTTTDPLCQPNANRFGTTKLLGYFLNSELQENPCAGACTPYGAFVNRNDSLFEVDDTLQPQYFWEKMRDLTGLNPESSGDETDLHMAMTYVYDYELPVNDTFTVYSVVTSVHNGDTAQLGGNLDAAFEWYRVHLRSGCEQLCGCCVGITGNVDGDSGELTDIGDLTALIAYLYIPPNPEPTCPAEANIDGDSGGLIDIGDLTGLIAYLYIPPNPEPAPCQ